MTEQILCQNCKRPIPKAYLKGLCFDCSMKLTGMAPVEYVLAEDPIVVIPMGETAMDEAIAKGRELTRKGFVKDFPWEKVWTFENGHITRLKQQVAHIAEWLDEAQRDGSWVKIHHAIASLKVLSDLLPGGDQ